MNKFKNKFSVVMAIYNTEDYLEEAIDSVINQDIGFVNNIQLILIDDGSLDSSNLICKKYKRKFPNNILYIRKKNGGVSSARNLGLKYINGKYVNFLDSDDKLSLNAFSSVYNFFEKYNDNIDLVSIPIYFFDQKKGEHILNYKYYKNRVIDLFKEYDMPQLSISSSFIKTTSIKNNKFDEKLKYAEDAKLISEILISKMSYGVVKEAKYFYRRRKGENVSAIQNSYNSVDWYIPYLSNFSINLLNNCDQKFKYIPKYFQFLIMYDLQWKLNVKKLSSDIFNKNSKEKFLLMIKQILNKIDNSVVLEQKNINDEIKIFCFYLKGKRLSFINNIKLKNKVYFDFDCLPIKIEFVKIEKNKLVIEGFYNFPADVNLNNVKIFLYNDKKKKKTADCFYRHDKENYIFGIRSNTPIGFKISIKLEEIKIIKFHALVNGIEINPNIIKFGKFSYNNMKIKDKKNNQEYFFYKKNNIIFIKKITLFKKISVFLFRYLKLLKKRKFKVIMIRFFAFVYSIFNYKDIWLISDRKNRADDNGEHFFNYLRKVNDKNMKIYFVINKFSQDFLRLKNNNFDVIDPDSLKYKIIFLNSKFVVSSHGEDVITNPFGKNKKKYIDLFNFKYIFLQHGIIKDDLSAWLNKYNKNINLFITSGKKEYYSILNNNYFYDSKVVKLTGLSRYDNLNSNVHSKIILIMPTWRANLASKTNNFGERIYSDKFKKTNLFKFYNNLINDERILKELKKINGKILFVPHPNFEKQLIDFDFNDFVINNNVISSYQDAFKIGSLLITDYSSVFFDFSYLYKPVIYSQFDYNEFFEGQIYDKGYFSYSRNGFGPVTLNYEDTVQKILKYINNDFVMEKKYINRVNTFFEFNDNKNCHRIFKEIKKIK